MLINVLSFKILVSNHTNKVYFQILYFDSFPQADDIAQRRCATHINIVDDYRRYIR